MPHIWSPLFVPTIKRAHARHVVVVHDADPHPGDHNGIATRWLLREAQLADHVVTLSQHVKQRLISARGFRSSKISVLFHPDLAYGATRQPLLNERDPLRLAFVGRVLSYKGLDLLVQAAEQLLKRQRVLELGVYGHGKIEPSLRRRLSTFGANVVNRWLSHDELSQYLSHTDVVVAAHKEASQSGVIAAAFGAGVPVIVTPVGGLIEQVIPEVTGIVAESTTPEAIADAIERIALDRMLLARLKKGIATTREQRSTERFFRELCQIALG